MGCWYIMPNRLSLLAVLQTLSYGAAYRVSACNLNRDEIARETLIWLHAMVAQQSCSVSVRLYRVLGGKAPEH